MKRPETNPTQAAIRACYAAAARASKKSAESPSDAQIIGYSSADLDAVPEGADMGLGCGNPLAIAELRPGETVADLGSGGGIDCFLAAERVGPRGRVIGVDMTPEMLSKARALAVQAGQSNVEFRLGEIEHLPIADGTIDVIISNCVINLSPDKEQVFRDAFRVLKRGGRIRVSDVVATRPVPQKFRDDKGMVCGCMGGAATIEQLRAWFDEIGFVDARVEITEQSRALIKDWAPGTGIEDYVASALILARKPR